MKNRIRVGRLLGAAFTLLAFMACSSEGSEGSAGSEGSESAPAEVDQATLAQALTLHASFDNGPGADFARGDPQLYTAPAWDRAEDAVVGIGNPDVQIVPDQGRFGSALHFTEKNLSAIFFRAEDKVSYSSGDWSGTISFWLNLSPDQELAPGYCDPIQITDQSYNDAAIWVDFTDTNPRQFRLGVFGDLESWNPEGLPSDENPGWVENLVVVEEPPFQGRHWTHVVITHSGLNSEGGGSAKLYLDGELQGTIQDILEPFSWDLSKAQIRLGVNFVGLFDELALFDRALTQAEVAVLFELEGGVASLTASGTAQGVSPDDLDQSPEFDPAEPEPIPEDHFDQSRNE